MGIVTEKTIDRRLLILENTQCGFKTIKSTVKDTDRLSSIWMNVLRTSAAKDALGILGICPKMSGGVMEYNIFPTGK